MLLKLKTSSYKITSGLWAFKGTSILVKNNIPQSEIKLNTKQQAMAVKATVDREINIPHDESELSKLLDQLPNPFIIL